MIRNKAFRIFLITICLLMIFTTITTAQDSNPNQISDDEVNAIAKQLYCPVCENIPLDVCGTQACIQWRELIREKLAEGWDGDQIKEYFVLQYGDRVLAEPPRRGINLLVYLIPPMAFLAGVYILFRGIQSWRDTNKDMEIVLDSNDEKVLDNYISRIENELQQDDK